MLHLGIDEFIRNIKRNIMIIIQLTAIFILSVLIVSVYDSQTRMSRAVMKYIDGDGIYYSGMGKDASVMSDKELLDGVAKVENIIHPVETSASETKDGVVISAFELIAYDESNIDYIPHLKSGKWHNEVEEKEGEINIVVAENAMGYSTGDIIEVECYTSSGEMVTLKLKITGTVYEKTMIFGAGGNWNSDNNSYLDMYSSAYDSSGGLEGVENILAVMSEEDIEKYDLFWQVSKGIIDFEDDITEEELEKNKEILKERCNITDTVSMAENSGKILFNKLSGIVIVFIVLCIITITSIICSGAVTFLYERRNYGIYFITGNSWNNTILLTMINWVFICISSVCLSGVILGIGMLGGFTDNYAISFTWTTAVAYIVIIAVTVITALIIPINMLRKNQPVQILKNNMEG